VQTFCIESMMQDNKALQAGTSHFLGQNFAKASGIRFSDDKGALEHAWTTSWGVSTRLVGAMVMTHADDDGMVCPPRLAPSHVVILPVLQKPDQRDRVLEYCKKLQAELRGQTFAGQQLRVELDARDLRGGDKVWQWIKKGVPLRLEVGPRDIDQDSVFMGRRDRAPKDKGGIKRTDLVATIGTILQEMQDGMLARARAFQEANTRVIDSKEEFYAWFTAPAAAKEGGPTPIHGGFAMTHFSGDVEVEKKVKDDLGVTVRCIPLDDGEPGTCPFTGKPSAKRVVWAKSY
jgi:prolyl-tRNA synthetase